MRSWFYGCTAILLLVMPAMAQGGILISPSIHWRSFSFDEGEKAITPNYYGLGGALNLGYSFGRVLDVGVYGDYTPATLTNVEPGKDDALLASYAGQIGLRISESVFTAIRYGRQLHTVLSRQNPEDEIDGRWSGLYFGGSLGAMFLVAKESAWQVSLDANRAEMKREDKAGDSARKLDSFSVSLAFVFNNRPSGSNVLSGFIKSLGY